jgi:capsular polysaccharide transport system permease protein
MTIAQAASSAKESFERHRRIIWALSLREVVTRYGRENLGFFWVVLEPLLFCSAVSLMWSVIRPAYEHGIRIVPFIITGYMPILLVRHVLLHGMYAVRVNAPLLYHRQISVLHMFFARCLVELVGVTFAFILIESVLLPMDLISLPAELATLYGGWFLLACMAFGLAMLFGSTFEIFEPIERIVSLITYVMVPLSGTFYMVAWVPARFRDYVLTIPFLNCVEMIRSGFFGGAVHAYYSIPYTVAWAAGLVLAGLMATALVRPRVFIE